MDQSQSLRCLATERSKARLRHSAEARLQPGAGQLDDALIVALVLRHFIRAGGEQMIRELWPGPERSLATILRLAGASSG